eukprot:scaffold11078_cov48-Attheya_sp.AAC.5
MEILSLEANKHPMWDDMLWWNSCDSVREAAKWEPSYGGPWNGISTMVVEIRRQYPATELEIGSHCACGFTIDNTITRVIRWNQTM